MVFFSRLRPAGKTTLAKQILRETGGACLAFLLLNCTFQVRLNPVPMIAVKQRINTDLGIYLDHSRLPPVYSNSGYCMLGAAHTWNIEIGEALKTSALLAFGSAFSRAEIVASDREFNGKSLILLAVPQIQSYAVTQDIQASLQINCRLLDKSNNTLYQGTINAQGGSQFFPAACLGVFGGSMLMEKTGNDAFALAFELLVADIIAKVDFTPYLK